MGMCPPFGLKSMLEQFEPMTTSLGLINVLEEVNKVQTMHLTHSAHRQMDVHQLCCRVSQSSTFRFATRTTAPPQNHTH